jgi:hypothetical protein
MNVNPDSRNIWKSREAMVNIITIFNGVDKRPKLSKIIPGIMPPGSSYSMRQ